MSARIACRLEMVGVVATLAFALPSLGAVLDGGLEISLRSARTDRKDSLVTFAELRSQQLPKATRKLFDRAIKLDRKGDTLEALVLVERALAQAPDYVAAHTAAAIANLKLGRYEDARLHVDRAFELDPTLLPAREVKGILLFETGQYLQARAVLEKVVRQTPTNQTAWHYLVQASKAVCEIDQPDLVETCETDAPRFIRRTRISGIERAWRSLVFVYRRGFDR